MDTDRIEKTLLLKAPLSRVWRALADAKEFGSWFGMKFDGRFSPGQKVTGAIVPTTVDPEVAALQRAHEGLRFEIQIEEMIPERLFSFRWHPHAVDPQVDYSEEPTTLVSFRLEEKADGVLLTLVESGFDRIPPGRRATAFAANENGWSLVLRLIEGYLAKAA